MKNFEPSFADRLNTGAKAKQALLKKAKEKDPRNDPGFAERQVARMAAAKVRDERKAQRKAAREAAKLAEEARKAKELADAEAARIAEEERLEAEALAEAELAVALAEEQKAERDRRYAARKARKAKKRR